MNHDRTNRAIVSSSSKNATKSPNQWSSQHKSTMKKLILTGCSANRHNKSHPCEIVIVDLLGWRGPEQPPVWREIRKGRRQPSALEQGGLELGRGRCGLEGEMQLVCKKQDQGGRELLGITTSGYGGVRRLAFWPRSAEG